MILEVLAALPLLFGLPEFRVSWSDQSQQALNIFLGGYNETVERCIESGLEVRYRYEMQLCRRRTGWFHACGERQVVIQSREYDAISQSYRILRDRLGDERAGLRSSAASLSEGLAAVSNVTALPLDFLSAGDESLRSGQSLYVSARVLATCRGQYNETLARIGYLLTLGMVRVSAINTGWIDFNLEPQGVTSSR